jgi:hypothetical protein
MPETLTLEDAIFPTVTLELHKPIYNAAGVVFAATGSTVLARGRERGQFEGIILTNPHTRQTIECTFKDLTDVSVIA